MKNKEVKCPISEVALLLSDAWTMMIMHFLIESPKRFCELERSLDGISTRTLTNKLKKLEESGLILKTEDGPYSSTEKGRGLRIVENAMRKYQEQHL